MTNGNTSALIGLQAIAAEALAAFDTCHQISPFSARRSAFNLDDAYRVTAAIRQMREMRGEMSVGRKIGFTNRTVWAGYGPISGTPRKPEKLRSPSNNDLQRTEL